MRYRDHSYRGSSSRFTLGFFCIVLTLAFLVISTIEIIWSVQFDRNCEGYLKRAADANTVPLAMKELDRGIKYLTDNKLTTGFTSAIYTTPDEDIEFLYTNLTKSLEELQSLPANATTLEKSNTLMKLRETLLDEGKSSSVTMPMGISRYPYNRMMGILMLGSLFLAILFGICWVQDI